MKFPALPPNPSNADLGAVILALHECVEDGKRQTAKNRQTVLKLIAANRVEARGWFDELEARMKRNEDGFALWLARDNERGRQLTTLIEAIGADKPKPHKSLMAMSQWSASVRIMTMVGAGAVVAPLIGKMINAAWPAIPAIWAVLLK